MAMLLVSHLQVYILAALGFALGMYKDSKLWISSVWYVWTSRGILSMPVFYVLVSVCDCQMHCVVVFQVPEYESPLHVHKPLEMSHFGCARALLLIVRNVNHKECWSVTNGSTRIYMLLTCSACKQKIQSKGKERLFLPRAGAEAVRPLFKKLTDSLLCRPTKTARSSWFVIRVLPVNKFVLP